MCGFMGQDPPCHLVEMNRTQPSEERACWYYSPPGPQFSTHRLERSNAIPVTGLPICNVYTDFNFSYCSLCLLW